MSLSIWQIFKQLLLLMSLYWVFASFVHRDRVIVEFFCLWVAIKSYCNFANDVHDEGSRRWIVILRIISLKQTFTLPFCVNFKVYFWKSTHVWLKIFMYTCLPDSTQQSRTRNSMKCKLQRIVLFYDALWAPKLCKSQKY